MLYLEQSHCDHRTHNTNVNVSIWKRMQFSSAEDASFKAVRLAIQSFNALHCSSWPSLCQSMLPHLLDGGWQARKSPLGLNMSKSDSIAGRAHPSGHTSWILGTLPKLCPSECSRNKSCAVPWVAEKFLGPYKHVVFPTVVWVIPSDNMSSFFTCF